MQPSHDISGKIGIVDQTPGFLTDPAADVETQGCHDPDVKGDLPETNPKWLRLVGKGGCELRQGEADQLVSYFPSDGERYQKSRQREVDKVVSYEDESMICYEGQPQ